MPFRCPVEGCRKQGNLSALRQHFGAKHPELTGQYSSAKLVSLIKTKGTIKMTYPNRPDEGPQNLTTQRLVSAAVGFVAGLVVASLLNWGGYIGSYDAGRSAGPEAPVSRPNAR